VTAEQIEAWDLPSRPTKSTDPRTDRWQAGESVELDAIRPSQLRELVDDAVSAHIDVEAWDAARKQEAEDRDRLAKLVRRLDD